MVDPWIDKTSSLLHVGMAIENGTPLPIISHFVPDNHHSHRLLPVFPAPISRRAIGVLPQSEHGHLRCAACGRSWEIDQGAAAALVRTLADERGFAVDLSHLAIVGRCAQCQKAG